jgi:hypothetical protein
MRTHQAESAMPGNMSDERRQIIDHIVKAHTGIANPNWWGPLEDSENPEMAITYRQWATTRAPTLRAELEALPDSALVAEIERCNQPGQPEWFAFFRVLDEAQEKAEELERFRQYHRSIAQKVGHTHLSRKQPPEIVEACKDMYAKNPRVSMEKAYNNLSVSGKGYKMPDGQVVRFTRKIERSSFRRYWRQRCPT